VANFCARCGPPVQADQHAKIEFVRGYTDRIVPLCLDCYHSWKMLICRG